jgi:hypothetical protein
MNELAISLHRLAASVDTEQYSIADLVMAASRLLHEGAKHEQSIADAIGPDDRFGEIAAAGAADLTRLSNEVAGFLAPIPF